MLVGLFLLPYIALVIERNLTFPVIINPDGINYSLIAEEYSEGNFRNAINTYWGPALSWLMAIPIAFGAEALTTYRIITVLTLFACLLAIWWLMTIASFRPEVRFITLWATGLMMLGWSVEEMTPDLLMLLVMLLLFVQLLRLGDDLSVRRVVITGLLGGIGFLVKPFGLPLFVAAWTVFCAYVWVRDRDASSVKFVGIRYLQGLASFLAVALPWIAAMSWKFGEFTTGTSGRLNLLIVARPGSLSADGPPPQSFAIPPPFDPSPSYGASWNPLASFADLEHFTRNFFANVSGLIEQFSLMSFVLSGVAIVALMGLVHLKSELPELVPRALLFSAVYVGLYCLVLVNTRYIWPAILLLCLAGLALVNAWATSTLRYRWAVSLVAIPLAMIMIAGPNWRPEAGIGRETLDLIYSAHAPWRAAARDGHDDAELLEDTYEGDSIASNSEWARSLNMAFFLRGDYYGTVIAGESPEITTERLDEFKIDTFVYWGDPGDPKPTYLGDYRLSDTFHDGRLKIYTRNVLPDTG